jgi:cytochrome subunit of sulfide dehydrogenase
MHQHIKGGWPALLPSLPKSGILRPVDEKPDQAGLRLHPAGQLFLLMIPDEEPMKPACAFRLSASHAIVIVLGALASLSPRLAAAQSPPASGQQALYAQSLAATCANCHGTQGRAVEGSSVVSIAGLDQAYLAAQMKAFKTGARPATVMHQISKGYSDAQIESLAAYFAAQKK